MSKSPAKAKAVELAKLIAKARAGYVCEKCFKSKAQGWQMHGAHIMPETWAGTAADPDNIICLCAGCHAVGGMSQHQNPIPFSRWFEAKWPGRYDKLEAKAVLYSRTKFPKIDWDETVNELKEILNGLV